jgi:ABC-type phosphate transport system substrate-binding protein
MVRELVRNVRRERLSAAQGGATMPLSQSPSALVGIMQALRKGKILKRALFKCGALAVSALTLGAGSSLLTAGTAHATLPSGQTALTSGGSDTTEKVMTRIMADLDNRSPNGHVVRTRNIPASPKAYDTNDPFYGITANKYNVQGDASCVDQDWTKDGLAPGANTASTQGVAPFGSGAGKKYLVAQNAGTVASQNPIGTGTTCIDIGRSSSGPGSNGDGQNLTGFEYYAFALDGVSWATTSLKAPSTLTRQQLDDIYDCNVTDWGQLPGGTSGPIQRYFPQSGSGTRDFFTTDILGKAKGYIPPSPGGSCPNTVLIEENEATQVVAADLDKAILPYSAAVWSYHAQNSINPTVDLRNGARLGGVTTLDGSNNPVLKASPVRWDGTGRKYRLDTTASGVVKETNVKQEAGASYNEATGSFPGIRFVYNVLDPTRTSHTDALATVGFDNSSGGAKSPLCDNGSGGTGANENALILQYGFAPLNTTGGGAANAAASTCRAYTVP